MSDKNNISSNGEPKSLETLPTATHYYGTTLAKSILLDASNTLCSYFRLLVAQRPH